MPYSKREVGRNNHRSNFTVLSSTAYGRAVPAQHSSIRQRTVSSQNENDMPPCADSLTAPTMDLWL